MANLLEEDVFEQISDESPIVKASGRPTGSSRAKRPIGEEELNKLLVFLEEATHIKVETKIRHKKCIALSYYLGTRISELLLLTVGDIRDAMETGEASLTNLTKTKRPRHLMFTPKSISVISKLFKDELDLAKGFNRNDLLFHSPHNKRHPLHHAPFTRQMNNLIHAALGNLYSSHSFRKGLLTSLAQTCHPRIAQKILNHSSISTTMLYFSPSDEDARAALNQVR